MNNRYIVIMAGGRGERFWPQSRLNRPKHLLSILGDKPLILETLLRATQVVPIENILVITNDSQKSGILEACPQLTPNQVIGEPIGRDTTAAIALATILVKNKDPEATFLVLPADHLIKDLPAFKDTLTKAFLAAESGNHLVTIGIQPTYPATGYGYIKRSDKLSDSLFAVEKFVEKPNLEKAQEYFNSGNYFWNAGMFAWKVSSIETAIKLYTPSIHLALFQNNILSQLNSVYPSLEKISIDYAILEKANNVLTIPSHFDWDDIGEWLAIERHLPKDSNGNVSKTPAISIDSQNNIIISENDHTLAIMGLSNMIIVHTSDATLICKKDDAQNIKKIVKLLENNPQLQHLL